MKTNQSQLLAIILGSLMFNWIFWGERLGLNLLVFSLMLSIFCLWFFPEFRRSRSGLLTLTGSLITGAWMVYHNSTMAIFTHMISVFIMVGFAHRPQLRTVMYSFVESLSTFFHVPDSLHKAGLIRINRKPKVAKVWRWVKLSLLPFIFLLIFFLIFTGANPIFENMTTSFMAYIGEVISNLFMDFPFLRSIFLTFGFTIVAWVVLRPHVDFTSLSEGKYADVISRKRKVKKSGGKRMPKEPFHMVELKYEYRSGLILMALINLLLLVVNAIDINWIWINFEYDESFNLSQFVHEGTYLLILSIMLSMAIMLFFFRDNLNFYRNNKGLIWLSRTWIAQNVILAISVGIRNYHYIDHFGLAYKRIGVIAFLTLTIFGLCALWVKIHQKKSSFFLWRINGWAVYGMLIALSTINWDGVIMRHNLAHSERENIDIEFLMSLSNKTLPLLFEHREIFAGDSWQHQRNDFNWQFWNKVSRFIRNQEQVTYWSWNYLDEQSYEIMVEAYEEHNTITPEEAAFPHP